MGFDAMMRGDGDVVSGWMNKLQSAVANVTPAACWPTVDTTLIPAASGR